jgi:hypothetical protein
VKKFTNFVEVMINGVATTALTHVMVEEVIALADYEPAGRSAGIDS